MIKKARNEEKKLKQGIKYLQNDLLNIDKMEEVKNEEFDKIIFSFVLHNIDPVEDMQEIIKKASKKIKKDGLIIALDPHAINEQYHNNEDTKRTIIKGINGHRDQIKIVLNPKSKNPTIIYHEYRTPEEYKFAFENSGLKLLKYKEIYAPRELKEKYPDEYKIPFFQIIISQKNYN